MEIKPDSEEVQRKKRSETLLKVEGVPVNKSLPVIGSESEANFRTKEDVAFRTLCLLVVAIKGEGLEQTAVDRIVEQYGLAPYFTPKERAFIVAPSPSQHDRVQFAWRYEAAWALLWALGYVEKLDKPTAVCDVPRAVTSMLNRTAEKFTSDAKFRATSEILDQADRIYRYHWAVVDARSNARKSPAKLEPGVTLERLHALNWLIGHANQNWDDIRTDT
jgi:hypothetical protein